MVGSYESFVSIKLFLKLFLENLLFSRTSAIFIALFVFIMCVPTLLAHQIDETTRGVTMNGMYYKYSVGFSTLMMQNGCSLMKGNLWLTGIFLKVSQRKVERLVLWTGKERSDFSDISLFSRPYPLKGIFFQKNL